MTASDTAPSKPEAICWRGSTRQSGSRCHSGNDPLDLPPSSPFFKLPLLPFPTFLAGWRTGPFGCKPVVQATPRGRGTAPIRGYLTLPPLWWVLSVQSPQPARRSGSLSDPVRHHHPRTANGRRHADRCRPCAPRSRNGWAACLSRIGKS